MIIPVPEERTDATAQFVITSILKESHAPNSDLIDPAMTQVSPIPETQANPVATTIYTSSKDITTRCYF
jgi:hypothetical protein